MRNYFSYQNNELYCESLAIKQIASKVGTPFYLYSRASLNEHFNRLDKAFSDLGGHLICYSMKANSSGAVLKNFINQGCGIDIVTGGELYRALHWGADPQKIVFSGVGKSKDEIDQALKAKILQFNVESVAELELINQRAITQNTKAPIALRVNPDVDPKTHPYISTGMKKAKFGINHLKAFEIYQTAQKMEGIECVGIDCHIGSQLTSTQPFVDALKRVLDLVAKLKKAGIQLTYLDFGGGLGICYDQETPPTPEEYANALIPLLKESGLKLILEPGRYLTGNSGALITQVLYTKQGDEKHFTIVDAASNDLMRPSLYQAFHKIWPVQKNETASEKVTDVVGPICESGDFFAKERKLPLFNSEELIAILSCGAYGFSMASNYNSRPKIAEVMVDGDTFAIIREKEELSDLIRGEKIPDFITK